MQRNDHPRRPGLLLAVTAAWATALAGCAPDYTEPYAVHYAASTTARASARVKIPLPDRALLEAPAEPDCGSAAVQRRAGPREGVTAAAAGSALPSISESTAGDVNADLALRIKLEYDRECYRQAEVRVRDRLQQLQASTTQTIRAVEGAQKGAR